MTFFKKSKEPKPELDLDQACKILEQVFETNNIEPNSIPLEVLTAYSNYRKERFSLQRLILVIILVLFLMLPFLFIPSNFDIALNGEDSVTNPTYTLRVTSPMLVERVNASIDGHNVPVYETDSRIYSIEPTMNGRMEVTVTLMNRQQSTRYVDVKNVDLEAPVVVSNDIDEENIYLYVSDAGTGVDYEHVAGIDANGRVVKPLSYDEESGCIVFSYPENSLNVYITDFAENKLQLVLSLK